MFASIQTKIREQMDRFVPPACAGCDGTASWRRAFCSICEPVAPRLTSPRCRRCSVPLETTASDDRAPSECSRCRRSSRAFDRVAAYWEYDHAVADAVRRIKYAGDLPALRALCRQARPWFLDRCASWPDGAPLVPIPAHRTELRDRGFHLPTLVLRRLGASDLARPVSRRLVKTEQTPRQAGLSYRRRRANVRGVFDDTGPCPEADTAVVFDDVMTTGSTVEAAARQLKDAGYDRVVALVLARAPAPGLGPHR